MNVGRRRGSAKEQCEPMSCQKCKTQATPALQGVGISSQSATAVFSREGSGLARCPSCGQFMSDDQGAAPHVCPASATVTHEGIKNSLQFLVVALNDLGAPRLSVNVRDLRSGAQYKVGVLRRPTLPTPPQNKHEGIDYAEGICGAVGNLILFYPQGEQIFIGTQPGEPPPYRVDVDVMETESEMEGELWHTLIANGEPVMEFWK